MTRGDLFLDKKEICNKLCISPEFFDLHFKKDPRLRVIEVRRKRKSWWETEKAKSVLTEIMYELSDWNMWAQ